ncbi:MAG: carbohydrate kinase family protein [Deltaproteobacteria bacterium]|nr:carbohydrate kinase family protein [Deltaproteobacteria bacterium]
MSASRNGVDVFLPATGRIFLDFIFTGAERVPMPGEEIYASGFSAMIGGAYNAARALHRLGVGVHIAADLGPDVPSQIVRTLWDRDRLPATFRRDVSHATAAITCSYSLEHDRAFLSYVDRQPSPICDPEVLSEHRVGHVLFTGIPPDDSFLPMMREARRLGIPIYMDSQYVERSVNDEDFRAMLDLVDVYFCNELEATMFTGEAEIDAACEVLSRLTRIAVIKLGPKGARMYGDGMRITQQAPDVAIVDTTGAGDCFVGGFVWARVCGEDPIGALRAGVAVGTLTCMGYGGDAAPNRERALTLIGELPPAMALT